MVPGGSKAEAYATPARVRDRDGTARLGGELGEISGPSSIVIYRARNEIRGTSRCSCLDGITSLCKTRPPFLAEPNFRASRSRRELAAFPAAEGKKEAATANCTEPLEWSSRSAWRGSLSARRCRPSTAWTEQPRRLLNGTSFGADGGDASYG